MERLFGDVGRLEDAWCFNVFERRPSVGWSRTSGHLDGSVGETFHEWKRNDGKDWVGDRLKRSRDRN